METIPWDSIDTLNSPKAEAAYIEAAFADGDPALIAAAVGDVARGRGMAQIARDAGLSREIMHKAFRRENNPDPLTLSRLLEAFGMKLTVKRATG